ncbi:MmcQ/YjbR family DNA-binding protein [Pseudonocardia kunmingensis]|uniref:MmcQ/YjbR family DNA-binding protein n=1 Tax=Pseudonocardia kunmingensis TaxID=630975 RepID=UPI001150A3C2|nr:MmcQ/YjbR family DNA-binding protein [Pseudonocardia kunmingensis]
MTTAREVFEDLAAEHLERPGAGRRMMFGRDCLTVGGRNVAFFHDDRLALQLPPETADALLTAGDADVPYMGKKPMRSWVAVGLPDGPAGVERWRALVAEAVGAAEKP